MKLRIALFFLFMIAVIFFLSSPEKKDPVASGPIKYDKELWLKKDGKDFPYRNYMIEDVRFNLSLKQLEKDSILQLLGKPYKMTDEYLFYRVAESRLGFFTLHAKTLVIKLTDEEGGNKIMIHQ